LYRSSRGTWRFTNKSDAQPHLVLLAHCVELCQHPGHSLRVLAQLSHTACRGPAQHSTTQHTMSTHNPAACQLSEQHRPRRCLSGTTAMLITSASPHAALRLQTPHAHIIALASETTRLQHGPCQPRPDHPIWEFLPYMHEAQALHHLLHARPCLLGRRSSKLPEPDMLTTSCPCTRVP